MSTISIILLSSIGIRFYSDLWQVDGFLRVLRFPPPIKLTPRYNRNIVESGVITSSSKQTNKSINRYNQHLFTDDWRSKCGISKQRSNLKTNILCYPEMAKSSKPISIFIEKSSSNLFICVFFLVRAMMLPFFTVCSVSIMDQKTDFNQAKKNSAYIFIVQ